MGVSVPIFTMEPYRNVAIGIGKVQIHLDGFKADYVVLRNPTDIDLDSDPGFHKYLHEVIREIIEDGQNNKNNTP